MLGENGKHNDNKNCVEMLWNDVRVESEFSQKYDEGICMEKDKLDKFSLILNCSQMNIPFKYLGMLIGKPKKKKSNFGGS